ncbi:MAG: twin-arginine translocase TatA/TatE family subunit [Alistipes sp.]|nr:twin-arginine translocase TatA/TatE family subunit [Alistipes sp.]
MMMPLFLGRIGLTEILLLALLIVVLFGAKKIPELMRSMGRGVKEFKDGMEGKSDEQQSNQ